MTEKELESILAGIVPVVREHITKALGDMTQRVKALEARPMQKWAGTHVEGVEYAEAALVTRGGSLWVATAATSSTPGTPGSDWRLIVKRGQV